MWLRFRQTATGCPEAHSWILETDGVSSSRHDMDSHAWLTLAIGDNRLRRGYASDETDLIHTASATRFIGAKAAPKQGLDKIDPSQALQIQCRARTRRLA